MESSTNLYINGCSFTAGHELKNEETWPTLLSKKLNSNTVNMAANGQSLDSIILNSVNHLANANPANTKVIIGLTWKERFGLLINGSTINITPADLGINKTHFQEKFSTWRRAKSPLHTNSSKGIDISFKQYEKDRKRHYLPLEYFTKYYEALVDLDLNLDLDLSTKHLTSIVMLQSYLKAREFEYRFITWDESIKTIPKSHVVLEPLYNLIDQTKVIEYNFNKAASNNTGHPDTQDCIEISNLIYEKL